MFLIVLLLVVFRLINQRPLNLLLASDFPIILFDCLITFDDSFISFFETFSKSEYSTSRVWGMGLPLNVRLSSRRVNVRRRSRNVNVNLSSCLRLKNRLPADPRNPEHMSIEIIQSSDMCFLPKRGHPIGEPTKPAENLTLAHLAH